MSTIGTLRKSDRCDACDAQAYVLVIKDHAGLMFCGHHFVDHEPSLTAKGFSVAIDQRWQLTAAR